MVLAAALLSALVLVHGTVAIDGKPARGALIEFTRAQRLSFVRTDARGRYSTRLTPGTWHVAVVSATHTTPTRFVVRVGVTSQTRNFVCLTH
jgi:hypothetical protein